MSRTSSRGPWLIVCGVVAAVLAIAPTAYAADPLKSMSCAESTQSFARVFDRSPWYDPGHYTLSPGADMEAELPDWTLSGGAAVSGNESYFVGSTVHERSLGLPDGASVTTAPICVGLAYPWMRFFLRNTGASSGRLKVEIRSAGALGIVTSLLPIPLAGTSSWKLSPPILLVANLGALLKREGLTPISIRFTAVGGAWQIDDVYVDPYRSR